MINVVVTVDENYVRPLGVMLHSLSVHVSVPVKVYILTPGLSEKSQDNLEKCIAGNASVSLVHIKVGLERFSSLYICRHLSSVCYFRFALYDILPDSVERVIYLDPDMVVLSDLNALWQIDLGDKPLGAVGVPFSEYEKIGMPVNEPYFCSGVLLINLKLWGAMNAGELLFQKGAALGKRIFGDQDVLNLIFQGQWKALPLKWNKTEAYFMKSPLIPYSREEISNASEGGIVHYTGSCKPWHFSCRHPQRKLYWKYLRHTPWKNTKPEDISFRAVLIKMIPFRFKNHLGKKLGL